MKIHQNYIDEKSFRYYYDLYFTDLCRSLNYYTSDIQIIEDTVQDVFVSLWENRLNVKISHIKTYLFTAVRNKMFNLLRDSKKFEKLQEINHIEFLASEGEQSSFNEELYLITQQAIDSLPEKCKEVFLLSKKENYTYKQIAEHKRISVKTVENQMGIAIKKIKDYVSHKAAFSILFPSMLWFL